jgi:heme exporter protein CcmD
MREFLSMGGNGAYVWSAYGITLAILVWNIWTARARLKRNRAAAAAADVAPAEPARRPTVRKL